MRHYIPLLLVLSAACDRPPPADATPSPGSDAGACALQCGSECCQPGQTCDAYKGCVSPCVPSCAGKACGSDGCGGTCGACPQACVAGACVECDEDADCRTGSAHKCDPTTHACVGCVGDADCGAAWLKCDPVRRVCSSPCSRDQDCAAVPGAPTCDPTKGTCVGCLTSANCAGAKPVCDGATQTCVVCAVNGDCAAQPGKLCKAKQACVECLADTDCTGRSCSAGNFCGECVANANCPSTKPLCDVPTRTCLACRSDTDCAAATPKCDAQVRCVQCLGDADCASVTGKTRCGPAEQCVACLAASDCPATGYCSPSHTCTPPPPPDTCATAQTLTFVNDAAHASGTTVGAKDDARGSCSSGAGQDAVYAFTLATTRDVAIKVTPPTGSSYSPNIYVRRTCDSAALADEVACDEVHSGGAYYGQLKLASLKAGTYYLWADSAFGRTGAFDVDVTLSAPLPGANDTCQAAEALVFDASGNAAVSSTTTRAKDDSSSPCGGQYQADLVYRVDVATRSSLQVVVTSKTSGVTPRIYLRPTCSYVHPASDKCAGVLGQTATISGTAVLPPGSYWLWVDGGAFDFDLTAKLTPVPVSDACSRPEYLFFDQDGNATVQGTTASSASTFAKCGGTQKDVVYELVNPLGTLRLDATVTAAYLSYPALGLQGTCDASAGASATCSSPAGYGVSSVRAMVYGLNHLWVSADGAYTLKAKLGADGDACDASVPSAIVGGTVAGDLTTMSNDNALSCGGAGGGGRDFVYLLDAGYHNSITISVTPTDSSWRPVIGLRGTTSCGGAEIGCSLATGAGGSVTLTRTNTYGKSYYVWVDAYAAGTGGGYTLTITGQ